MFLLQALLKETWSWTTWSSTQIILQPRPTTTNEKPPTVRDETESETAMAMEVVAETTETAHATIEIGDGTTGIGTVSENGIMAAKTTESAEERTIEIEREIGKEIETMIAANRSLNHNHRPTIAEDLLNHHMGMGSTGHQEEVADMATVVLVQEEATASQEAEVATAWAVEDTEGMADRIVMSSPTTNTSEMQARRTGRSTDMPEQQQQKNHPRSTNGNQ